MDERIREKEDELMDLLDRNGFSTTKIKITEYSHGDPTRDPTVTGAEVELTAYISLDEPDEDNPFRLK